jgi:hypothetical protein
MTEYDPKLARFILGRLEKVAKVAKVEVLASTASVGVDPVHPTHEKMLKSGPVCIPLV